MLTDVTAWLALFKARLLETFPDRVIFLGLQGSRSRGEATPDSDIDVVTVLDRLDPEDIRRYRAMLDTLPERALICGFLGGLSELRRWEPSDLFQFCHDTTPVIGTLEPLLAAIAPEDVARAVRIGACNIYHGCVHTLCHGRSDETLRGLYKSACFTLQALHFLRTGDYARQKNELLPKLAGMDAQVLEIAMRLRAGEPVEFEPMAELLFQWAQGIIATRWQRMETARFILYYDVVDSRFAERLSRLADGAFDRAARDFAIPMPEGKYDLYLCPDVSAYLDLTGISRDAYEDWMVGSTDEKQRRLCVLSPRVTKYRTPEQMERVAVHEATHIAMDTLRSGDACPVWLAEGVATLYAGQVSAGDADACPPIAEWPDGMAFAHRGGYDYAGAYVWYLMKRYGAERFRRVYAGEEDASALIYPGFERDAVMAWNRRHG